MAYIQFDQTSRASTGAARWSIHRKTLNFLPHAAFALSVGFATAIIFGLIP